MAHITGLPALRHFRTDAANAVRLFKGGKLAREGRGLSFWFNPARVSVAEIPLADRELTFLVKSQTADFQDLAVQGTVLWAVADVAKLSDRVDFSVDLRTGQHLGKPDDHVSHVLTGLVREFADSTLKGQGVKAALEAGLAPLQARIMAGLAAEPTLTQMGVSVVAVRVSALSPSSELARALQAPTFEALQQKADEATFTRRALAVDKERAIAENELANRIELAARRAELIARDDANARAEAEAGAAAARIAAEAKATTTRIASEAEAARTRVLADAEAMRIRAVEQAEADMEAARMATLSALDATQLFALAARDFAAKVEKIDSVSVTPDTLAGLVKQLGLR